MEIESESEEIKVNKILKAKRQTLKEIVAFHFAFALMWTGLRTNVTQTLINHIDWIAAMVVW